ncbi:hypothetical protein FHS15_000837 [Paenibacillus castaneae]|nr:hypothetical protein [Paenibacillus castaneae]
MRKQAEEAAEAAAHAAVEAAAAVSKNDRAYDVGLRSKPWFMLTM